MQPKPTACIIIHHLLCVYIVCKRNIPDIYASANNELTPTNALEEIAEP